jgi:hypothetical protein
MTNTNKSNALLGNKPKTLSGLYEVSTLDEGTILIKRKVAPAKPLVQDGKAKTGPVPNA